MVRTCDSCTGIGIHNPGCPYLGQAEAKQLAAEGRIDPLRSPYQAWSAEDHNAYRALAIEWQEGGMRLAQKRLDTARTKEICEKARRTATLWEAHLAKTRADLDSFEKEQALIPSRMAELEFKYDGKPPK